MRLRRPRRWAAPVSVAAAVWLLYGTCGAKDYYVAKNGSDGNPGSKAQPWLTIQRAIDAMRAGDTTHIGQGVYRENLVVGIVPGTAGRPITLRSRDGDRVVVTPPRMGWRDPALWVRQSDWIVEGLIFRGRVYLDDDHVTLRDCEIDCRGWEAHWPPAIWVGTTIAGKKGAGEFVQTGGVRVRKGAPVDGAVIEGCTIHDYVVPARLDKDAHGIATNSATNLVIRNNDIGKCQGDCVQLSGGPWRDVLIEGNRFWTAADQSLQARYPGENGVDLKGKGGGMVIIRNNIFHGFRGSNFGSGLGTGTGSGGYAITSRGVAARIRIEGNRIYDCDNGVMFHSNRVSDVPGGPHPEVTIQRNVICDLNAKGPRAGHIPTVFSLQHEVIKLKILHNTVTNIPGKAFGRRARVYQGIIRNNIFFRVSEPSGNIGQWGTFDHNMWSRSPVVQKGDGDRYDTDPLFVNESQRDFRLRPGSPAIDAGTSLGLRFNGPAPDLGAFERQGRKQSDSQKRQEPPCQSTRTSWDRQSNSREPRWGRIRFHEGRASTHEIECTGSSGLPEVQFQRILPAGRRVVARGFLTWLGAGARW